MAECIDMTGRQCGDLTVIKQDGYYYYPKGAREAKWLCQCICGKFVSVRGAYLRNGHTKSCGCKTFEYIAKQREKNRYYIDGDVAHLFTKKGEEILVDSDDVDRLIKACRWYVADGYAFGHIGERPMPMHRFITNANKPLVVDHRNHNKLDNRKSNLRVCTSSQNSMNRMMQSNNTSGVIGVHYDKHRKKWKAEIKINRKNRYIGRYNTIEEAVNARKAAEEVLFGEFAYKEVK